MYDLNLSVPDLTSQRYTDENKFRLLKNYLYELNEALAIAMSNGVSETKVLVSELKASAPKDRKGEIISLKNQSLKRFAELKEQIFRTADEIETEYKAEISKTQNEIESSVEALYVTKSEYGEYKNDMNTQISQTSTQIQLAADNTEEVKKDLETFKKTAHSEIKASSNQIISQVESTFETKKEADMLESRLSSQIIQTENSITDIFSNKISGISDEINAVGESVSEFQSELDVYIRRGELEDGVYGIEIGRSDSHIKARFTNERLSFFQGSVEVAYISGSSLYITNADILDYLRIGNKTQGYFLFDTTSNGLEVRWIDAE